MTTAAAGALCSATVTCASSGCCSFISKAATVATGDTNTTTLKFCVAAGTAANAVVSVTAIGTTATSQQAAGWFASCTNATGPCNGYNGATACAAAKAGSSTLVASAAAVATAVYMM